MTKATVGGHCVRLRLLERADERLIRRFYYRLSPDTIYRRFLAPVVPPADTLVRRLTDVDHCRKEALVALDARGIAGIARYAASPNGSDYDVAVVVADDWQGRGLGRMLIRRLAHIARRRGISRFHATMLGDNRRAQALVLGLAPTATMRFSGGVIEAEIPLRRPA